MATRLQEATGEPPIYISQNVNIPLKRSRITNSKQSDVLEGSWQKSREETLHQNIHKLKGVKKKKTEIDDWRWWVGRKRSETRGNTSVRFELCAGPDAWTDCGSLTPTVNTHIVSSTACTAHLSNQINVLKRYRWRYTLTQTQPSSLSAWSGFGSWIDVDLKASTYGLVVYRSSHDHQLKARLVLPSAVHHSDPVPTQELWSKIKKPNTLFSAEWSLLDIEERAKGVEASQGNVCFFSAGDVCVCPRPKTMDT